MGDHDALHREAIVFDGLHVCNWSRRIYEDWHAGGLTGVNCSSVIWENLEGGLRYVADWKQRAADNADLMFLGRSVADIRRAKVEGRTAAILGWQNTSPIEDRLDYIGMFADLGVRIMQLTYNTQNYSGAGYLEANDSGLTGFGQEMIGEMNRLGVLCDLSHVGDKTSAEAIAASKKPVAFTHVLPRALHNVRRNKPDHLLRACAEGGGIIGISLFAPSLRAGNDATVDDVVEAMGYIIDVAGEDHVGIGTDFSTDHARPSPFLEWCNHDKGYGRKLTEFGHAKVSKPRGLERPSDLPNLTAAMFRRGWSEQRVRKLLGENWMRVLLDVWGS